MTNLTDRMRTCAAFILERKKADDPVPIALAACDAADLLIEAADMLDGLVVPLPPGEPSIEDRPMEIIPPPPPDFAIDRTPTPMWVAPGDTLPAANPYRSRNTCPKCDSRAAKTVHRQGKSFMLECPVCGHVWKRA